MKNHIIICGLGHIGFYTFALLLRTKKDIVVISTKDNEDWRWQAEAAGCTVLLGDARDDKLLIKAGIESADCILALTDQDMVNVSIMMDARKLNPNIRIVARMFDTEMAKHIADAFRVQQIFSIYELAAPIFTSSIHKQRALAQFTINNITYVVHQEKSGTHKLIENAILISSQQEFDLIATPVAIHEKKRKPSRLKRAATNLFEKFTYFYSPVLANFRLFLGIIFCVIVFAALFLSWQMEIPIIDALYFATTTVTTVGYGDFNFSHSSPQMKFFGCLLMLSGAAALAVLFSSITEIILSKKLQNIFGGRVVPKTPHVIVVGAQHLGSRVISTLLAEEVPVVVLESETTGQYSVDLKRQVAVIAGNPRSTEALEQAGIDHALAIITIMDNDVDNLGVSLAAKKLNSETMTITQILDPRLNQKIEKEMAINRVLSMSHLAAPYFAAAAVLGEKIVLALTWQEQLIFISEHGSHKERGEIIPDLQIHRVKLEKH
jgi:Trk K+ transport system NAD-binding subunit